MKYFLAKSNPVETIQEHTDNLINNFNLLKTIYPNLNIDWDILYLSCLYHDLGKINSKFQSRISTGKKTKNEIPHGILSLAFINYKELKKNGYTDEDISILFHSIGYHHERNFSLDYQEIVEEELQNIKEYQIPCFQYEKIKNMYIKNTVNEKYFTLNERIYRSDGMEKFLKYVLVKGLLNRIDYASSAHIDVEIKNDFLIQNLNTMMDRWKIKNPKSKWNDLQMFMIENRDKNTIVTAQTGMGKTEAGLLWIGNNKGFFTLPLKTAINSIYQRVSEYILENNFYDKIGLLHSDTRNIYMELKDDDENNSDLDIQKYYDKTKQLSLPLTICTLDQLFDFVFRYRGFEHKLATLSYSKIVIDEIQMYSPDLLAYLITGIKYITKVGGNFSILTATLPKFIVEILQNEGIKFVMPETPFIDDSMNRHSMNVIEEKISVENIIKLYNKNKVLVICNTVKEAQRIYDELKSKKINNINLLHSKFIKNDRRDKEEEIIKIGKYDFLESCIWITTQIAEASLDIDFDILATELSDVSGLFQRLGRCYRRRKLVELLYNCYVYIGNDNQRCSGVGSIIDSKIHEMSRQAIKNKDGVITESEKVNIVDKLYTLENLKGTSYLEKFYRNFEYLDMIEDYEKSKKEVQEKFRNIDTVTIIPLPIYEDIKNKNVIYECIDYINMMTDKNLSKDELRKIKESKSKKRNELMGYTLNIRREELNNIVKYLSITEYEKIGIINCEYSSKKGLVLKEKNKKENDANEIEDRIL